ncbi:MAG: endonuclease, partial [Bacteroidota bacterium]
FYFYTIYRDESDAVDPNYFPPQIDDLCDWHITDPVDLREVQRTEAIAERQDGKVNPFVIDCNLLMRTYCTELAGTFCISSVEAPIVPTPFKVLGVGRSERTSFVQLQIERPVHLFVDWYDTLGRKIGFASQDWVTEGTFQLNVGDFTGAGQSTSSQVRPIIGHLRLQDRDGKWYFGSVIVP